MFYIPQKFNHEEDNLQNSYECVNQNGVMKKLTCPRSETKERGAHSSKGKRTNKSLRDSNFIYKNRERLLFA
jgi:hypothetical protein